MEPLRWRTVHPELAAPLLGYATAPLRKPEKVGWIGDLLKLTGGQAHAFVARERPQSGRMRFVLRLWLGYEIEAPARVLLLLKREAPDLEELLARPAEVAEALVRLPPLDPGAGFLSGAVCRHLKGQTGLIPGGARVWARSGNGHESFVLENTCRRGRHGKLLRMVLPKGGPL